MCLWWDGVWGGMLFHSWSGPFLTSAWSASWRMSSKEWSSLAWWSCQAGQAPPGEAEATCCRESPPEPVWGWKKWAALVIQHQLIVGQVLLLWLPLSFCCAKVTLCGSGATGQDMPGFSEYCQKAFEGLNWALWRNFPAGVPKISNPTSA